MKHHEELTNLLAKQWEYVDKMAQEILAVGQPFLAAPTHMEENILNILQDDKAHEDLLKQV